MSPRTTVARPIRRWLRRPAPRRSARPKRCARSTPTTVSNRRSHAVFRLSGRTCRSTPTWRREISFATRVSGGPIRVRGDGTSGAVVHVCIGSRRLALDDPSARRSRCRPYNVGSESAITIGELAHAIARRWSPPGRVEIMRDTLRAARTSIDTYPAPRGRELELGLSVTVGRSNTHSIAPWSGHAGN